jgi:hypothetical protein
MTSLASGAELSADTFADFVARLRHDCIGQGVSEHCTADAIFVVKSKRYLYGIDTDYTDDLAIHVDDRYWHTIEEYLNDADASTIAMLDQKAIATCRKLAELDHPFTGLSIREQFETIGTLDEHSVYGFAEQRSLVSVHFTQRAAEAFIANRQKDYEHPLQVFVESQNYCDEFNAIKQAIMNGKLIFKDKLTGESA